MKLRHPIRLAKDVQATAVILEATNINVDVHQKEPDVVVQPVYEHRNNGFSLVLCRLSVCLGLLCHVAE